MSKHRFKLFDYIIIILSVALVAVLSVRIYSGRDEEAVLHITTPESESVYPLDRDIEIEVEGAIGSALVIISGGTAHIEESPCENKLCILAGEISKPGQWAACMPNRVFISIEGGSDDSEIDVLSY